jgi:hypothetical protein
VRIAVHFDDKMGFGASKVRDVRADWMLLPKMKAVRSVSLQP